MCVFRFICDDSDMCGGLAPLVMIFMGFSSTFMACSSTCNDIHGG